MGNVRVGLSLSSTDILSSALNLSVATSLLVDSGSLIRTKVLGTAADSNDLAIYIANQCSDRAYLYIKNLDSQLENYIYIHNDTDTGLVAKIDCRCRQEVRGIWYGSRHINRVRGIRKR